MSELDLTIGDMVGRDRFIFKETNDVRIDFVRRGDEIHIETYYKTMQAVFDENASLAADFSKNTQLSNLERVASIPTGLYYEWSKEGIIDDPERLKRRLNDSDFAKVRTNGLVI
ncbi:hypothetical protein [Agrobacterium tumefaciens]|uniref:Uncharacterized protein n=1 Tax=Agrobacterium tumefaciens TaxID=358 RepID=A0AA44JBF8_AGRTU|nr:hypothetical protein [Agrobacterium tumefaciens]NTB86855.1 hypothetical protein [Agrobacterium tumefaciens]NTC21184.1 hypothetical protein [Agrobacterium tumefaciens]NTC30732.1 hypothetical protein [Agrobacterium tumefaciens]